MRFICGGRKKKENSGGKFLPAFSSKSWLTTTIIVWDNIALFFFPVSSESHLGINSSNVFGWNHMSNNALPGRAVRGILNLLVETRAPCVPARGPPWLLAPLPSPSACFSFIFSSFLPQPTSLSCLSVCSCCLSCSTQREKSWQNKACQETTALQWRYT